MHAILSQLGLTRPLPRTLAKVNNPNSHRPRRRPQSQTAKAPSVRGSRNCKADLTTSICSFALARLSRVSKNWPIVMICQGKAEDGLGKAKPRCL